MHSTVTKLKTVRCCEISSSLNYNFLNVLPTFESVHKFLNDLHEVCSCNSFRRLELSYENWLTFCNDSVLRMTVV